MTNYERIGQMSVDEMSKTLNASYGDCVACWIPKPMYKNKDGSKVGCDECCRRYLESEAIT